MSYDVWLEIDTGGPEPACVGEEWNHTSNVAKMWRKAGADIAQFDGKPAGECVPVLRSAIAAMLANEADYTPMNPSNGWGSYDSCIRFLGVVKAGFEKHPKATVRVSY